jgi:lipoate-protein ligase A
MAIDKAILQSVSKKKTANTIRFYRWNPSAVSIGYFQSMKKVVDLVKCQELGIDYIRRITGGGAVYHDFEGELTYSVNCLNNNPKLPEEIMKIYEIICGALVTGLRKLNIDAEFKPVNDIVLKKTGRKISGSALTRREGVIQQHGTILRKVDVEKMFAVLIVPDEKIRTKMISSAKERVSSLETVLGMVPSFKEIRDALIEGFESTLEIKLIKQDLTQEEKQQAQNIAKEQFKSKEWLFKR